MAIYYVDYEDGSDSNNGTTTSTPFKHIPGDADNTGTCASTTPAAGDTICIKGGTTYNSGHEITIKSSGTSGSRITYDGNYPGFGDGTRAKFTGDTQIVVTGRDYVTIKNLEVHDNSTDFIVSLSTSSNWCIGLRVEGCYFHDNFVDYAVLNLWGTQDAVVTNNIFEYSGVHRNGFGTHTGGTSSTVLTDSTKSWTEAEQASFIGQKISNQEYVDTNATITGATSNTITCSGGLSPSWENGDSYAIHSGGRSVTYLRGTYPDVASDSTNFTFSNNTIDGWADSPIFFYGTHGTISGNTIKGLVGTPHSQGITYYYMADAGTGYIFDNYFTSARGFIAVEGMTNETIYTYNNIANCQGAVGYIIVAQNGNTGTWYVINNTFVGSSGPECGTNTDATMDIYFLNNITDYNFGDTPVSYDKNCCVVDTSNGGDNAVYSTKTDTFVNSALTDKTHYALKTGCSSISAGADMSGYGITTDHSGHKRPVSSWDLGALEWVPMNKINGVNTILISKIDGVAKSLIGKVKGVSF